MVWYITTEVNLLYIICDQYNLEQGQSMTQSVLVSLDQKELPPLFVFYFNRQCHITKCYYFHSESLL